MKKRSYLEPWSHERRVGNDYEDADRSHYSRGTGIWWWMRAANLLIILDTTAATCGADGADRACFDNDTFPPARPIVSGGQRPDSDMAKGWSRFQKFALYEKNFQA